MAPDPLLPLLPLWLIVAGSLVAGVVAGILFERTTGSAAKRAATSGWRRASTIAALSFLTMGCGTSDEVITPYHWSTS